MNFIRWYWRNWQETDTLIAFALIVSLSAFIATR